MARTSHTTLRTLMLAGSASLAIVGAAAAQDARTIHFNIPAEDLGVALNQVAQQSGQELVFNPDVARGKHAPPLRGDYTPQEALSRLLAGSGLSAHAAPNGSIVVEQGGGNGGNAATPTKVDEVVVTANKRKQTQVDVADSVNTVSANALRNLDAQKLADYVGFVPGLQIEPGANNGQQTVIIRGIAPQLTSPTTATYVDDVPVGAAGGGGAGAQLAVDVDPSELQQVEVLNGPQGTVYGASSLGGVVRYDTRVPNTEAMSGRIAVDAFGIDHGGEGMEARGAVSLPLIRDELAVSLSGHYRYDPGYLENAADKAGDFNWGRNEGGRFALNFTPRPDWQIRLSAMYDEIYQNSDNSVAIDDVTRQPTFGKYDQFHPDHASAATYQRLNLYSGVVTHTFEDGVSLTSATGYSTLKTHLYADVSTTFIQQTLVGLGLIPADDGVEGTIPYNTEHFTEELRLASPDSGRFRWMAGLFYQDETDRVREDYFALNPDGTVFTPAAPYNTLVSGRFRDTLSEYAGFGNATYYFQPNVWLTLGYRYSSIRQTFERTETGLFENFADPTAVTADSSEATNESSSYLATLSWKPAPEIELYARAASGYRPGGNQPLPAGAPANFQTTYQSDSIWNYEAGLKGSWFDDRLSGTLTAYWIDWSNIQQELVFNTFFFTGNGGRARSRGFEGALQAIPVEGLTITGDLSYTDATFLEDNPGNGIVAGEAIPYVSKWTGALSAEYTHPISDRWRAFGGGDMQFRSANNTIDGFREDAYETLGLHAGVTDGSIRLTVYVKNLTDQYRYVSAQSSVGSVPFYTTILQPRTAGLNLSKSF